MQARLAAEFGQLLERRARLLLLERHVGLEHQARHRQARRAGVRSREQRFGRVELVHVDGRARPDQRRQARRLRNRERLLRELARLAVPPFEQRDDRRILLAARAFDVAPAAALAHLARQPRDPPADAQQQVGDGEAGDDEHDERIERKLDAIRRRDEQRVARVELEQQRREHRERGQQQEREQETHQRPADAPPARSAERSRVAFSVRTAVRLARQVREFRWASASRRAA